MDKADHLSAIFSNLPCMVYQLRLNPAGDVRFTFVSEGVSLFGLSPEQVLADSNSLMGLIHMDDLDRVMQTSLQAAMAMQPWHLEFRMCHPDGHELWVEAKDQPIDHDGEAVLCTGYLIDITRRRELEAQLRSSEERFRNLVENANDIIFTQLIDGSIDYVSPNWSEKLGWPLTDVLGLNFRTLLHPDDVPMCETFISRILTTGTKQSGLEYRMRHAAGHWCWYTANASPRFDADGRLCGSIGIARDISERKEAELHMAFLAHHDQLTGLPNRALLAERVQRAILAAERSNDKLALMFIDLDRFKPINDAHGHAIGDDVLCVVAERIRTAVRAADTVARIGGDEFVVLLDSLADAAAALQVAAKIHSALRQPMQIEGLSLLVSSCIGIALYPEHGSTGDVLLLRADQAMYAAKEEGRNGIRLYAAGPLEVETRLA